jgi:glutamine synthetase
MTRHLYLPALFDYSGDIATTVATKADLGIEAKSEKALVAQLTDGIDAISEAVAELEEKNEKAKAIADPKKIDDEYRDSVIPAMDELRAAVDEMEKICGHDYWPVPSYNKMLFYV